MKGFTQQLKNNINETNTNKSKQTSQSQMFKTQKQKALKVNLPEPEVNPLQYDSAKQWIKWKSGLKENGLTSLPHTQLYNLLQKSLFGLSLHNDNLVLAIETFYDIKKIANYNNLKSSKPCSGSGSKCTCIIGYLLREQTFIDINKTEQKQQTENVVGDIKNSIEGKAKLSIGNSVVKNVADFKSEASSASEQKNQKKVKTKKFRYYLGHIILKNNIFQKRILNDQIINITHKLIQQKANDQQKSNSGGGKSQKQMSLIRQFSDQFGDVIPTKCDVGYYVAQYEQQSMKSSSQKNNLSGSMNVGQNFSAQLKTDKDQSKKKSSSNSNTISVLVPTIIRRQNYTATNTLAQLYQQTQQRIVQFNLQSQFFLLLVQKSGGKKQIVNLNFGQQKYQAIQYNQNDHQLNRLYLVGFYAIQFKSDPKCKFLVTCQIVSRTLNKKCKIYIRRSQNLNTKLKYYQVDQISIEKGKGYYYLNYQQNNMECTIFQTLQQLWKPKFKSLDLRATQQTQSFFYLQAFQTKNDLQAARIQATKNAKQDLANNIKPTQKKQVDLSKQNAQVVQSNVPPVQIPK